jgi:hypothetical protein
MMLWPSRFARRFSALQKPAKAARTRIRPSQYIP